MVFIRYCVVKYYVCYGCKKPIEEGNLMTDWGHGPKFHFDCIFVIYNCDNFTTESIKIPVKEKWRQPSFKSLEYRNKNPNFCIELTAEDLLHVREECAAAKEHKSPYFIPKIVKNVEAKCPEIYCVYLTNKPADGEDIVLQFKKHSYHPECLSKSGKINIDAKQIVGYSFLREKEKVLLDELFVKNSENYTLPKAEKASIGGPNQWYSKCSETCTSWNLKGLRIRYKFKKYHPKCLADMGKLNINGSDIGNYNSLSNEHKKLLDDCFKKSNIFDIPAFKKVDQDDYCNLVECLHADTPSKFPWPFTISCGQICVKFHGDIFHPDCFKSMNKVNMDAKDFQNYDIHERDVKREFDSFFVKNNNMNVGKINPNSKDSLISYPFEPPNNAFIRSTLEKLKIPFNSQALLFWAQVLFTEISTTTFPSTTHPISSNENSFFKCLSCFFTGKEDYHFFIKAGIQTYFYCNFMTFGAIDGIDFSTLDVTSDQFQKLYECKELTNIHFNIICSWLKCRIGIYSTENGLQKYGNWNKKSHPILLMKNENDLYIPVLKLA